MFVEGGGSRVKRFGFALLWAMGAYLLGAFGGGWLLSEFSSNIHDRSVEAAMTGAFFSGQRLLCSPSSWPWCGGARLRNATLATEVTRPDDPDLRDRRLEQA